MPIALAVGEAGTVGLISLRAAQANAADCGPEPIAFLRKNGYEMPYKIASASDQTYD
jgi:hypothetical protein